MILKDTNKKTFLSHFDYYISEKKKFPIVYLFFEKCNGYSLYQILIEKKNEMFNQIELLNFIE